MHPEPIWYNYARRSNKITFRDAGFILPITFYNNGSESGIIEDILVVFKKNKEQYFYTPIFLVKNSMPDINIKQIHRGDALEEKLTLEVKTDEDFEEYFNSILLKPHEQSVVRILFIPDQKPDRKPLEGDYVMKVFYLVKGKWKSYSRNISGIDNTGFIYGLFNIPDKHQERKCLVKKLLSNSKIIIDQYSLIN